MTTPERYNALRQLLDMPDESCMPRRGRRMVLAGDWKRREALKAYFERCYVQHQKAGFGIDESRIQAVRRGQAPWAIRRRVS